MAKGGASSRIRMALGADRAEDPTTWTKTDLTSRTQTDGKISIRRGGTGNAQEPQHAKCDVVLGNGDGALTPGYPASSYYPDLDLGTPVEIDVEAGSPTLLTPGGTGGGASTPDTATLDITGDIAVAIEVESPMRMGLDNSLNLAGKYRTTSDQRSWLLSVGGPFNSFQGCLTFWWSTAGTVASLTSITADIPVPRFDSGPAVYGCYLDVNNGAGGHTVTFYAGRGTIADLLADPDAFVHWTETGTGTTSIFASTAPLELGTVPESSNFRHYPGRVRRFVVVEGTLAGTIRANPVFTAQTPGATSFVDSTGKTWTLGADADIDGHATRLVGDLAAAGPAWPGHGLDYAAQVQWEIAGPLRRMRQRDEPLQSSLYRTVTAPVLADNVFAYWPLEDGAAATSAASALPGGRPMEIGGAGGNWRFAADNTLASAKPLPHVTSTISYRGTVPPYVANVHRADIFFRIDTPAVSPAFTWIMGLFTSGTGTTWGVRIDDTDVEIVIASATGATLVASTQPSDPRFFDTWCLLSVSMFQSGGSVAWDWKIVPIPLGLQFGTNGTFAGTVGRITQVHNWNAAAPTDGISFGHIIVSDRALGWLAPGDTAYVGEPAGQRFSRLCSEQGIVAIVDGLYGTNWAQALARGAKPMGPQLPIKLLDLLTECAVVERAIIGEAREIPGLVYRSNLYNQAPAITFTNELGNPFDPTKDDQKIINDLTVAKTTGESYRQVDQPSKDQAGDFPHQQTANTETVLQLPDIASAILHEVLASEMRIPSLLIDLGKDQALFADWLATCMGDLVQSDAIPPFYPAEEVRQILAGYTEEISRPHWRLTLNGTPAGVWDVGVRDDGDLGLRDTGGSVVAAEFDAGTDTSLSVATTLGPLWAETSVSNSGLPFDLDVGGYRVPCSDINDQGPIAFGAAGTAAHANNASITPGLPASTAAGNLLLAWTAIRNEAGAIFANDQGYVELVEYANCSLWGKIAGASEVAPTFTISGGVANADVSGQIVRFTGPFYDINRVLVAASPRRTASSQDINYWGVHVPEPACLILYLGWKQDDWTSVAAIAGATEIGEPDTTTGDDQGIVWDYLIQTTPADIADGSFVVTGGAAAVNRGLVVVLRSSVQVFTVSATVWPATPKTMPVGTPVKLWRPARRGLIARSM